MRSTTRTRRRNRAKQRASISNLPNELLLQVFENVTDYHAGRLDLWSLCIVSRRFHTIAVNLLYRSPSARWLEHRDIRIFLVRLIRTLLPVHNSHLRPKVRRLDLHLPESLFHNDTLLSWAGHLDEEATSLSAYDFISRLPYDPVSHLPYDIPA
jgi:hypothetical protein